MVHEGSRWATAKPGVECGTLPVESASLTAWFGWNALENRWSRLSADVGTRWGLTVAHTWDGEAVGEDEAVAVAMKRDENGLVVRVDAPFHDDPRPESEDLWLYEVVELMVVGADDAYLEVELSPHGRHLVLLLQGERNIVRRGATLDYQARIDGQRWSGVAHIPTDCLPSSIETIERLNAFAIHGTQEQRRYLAWRPTGGRRPDFHRLAAFGSFGDCAIEEAPPAGAG